MNNKVIDITYVKKEQKDFLEHLKSVKGIKCQDATYNVPYWLILALQSELAEILQASLVHKWWTNEEVDRKHLIEECADFLAHIGNLAIFLDLDADLIIELEEIQATAVETTFNKIAYWITTLNWNKRHAKNTLTNRLLPLFLELIYSLGFNIDELEMAYKTKMETNYKRFK
ncbi:dUTP diphosphatase [Romboutsia sp.]|uniref:dUTP diphosphatase n=1 Tax=Romboutsia sp. TaxID=1965302 RepID=UPI002CD123CE|nr:dUTP diphosphatase [Romboutsia sp.]HSQ89519.1 dUTP diphosphatase [Romboutsia sp.]